MNAIQTKDIHVNLGNFHLSDISVKIPKHSITAIVGPNGSGKSTLLKTIARLMKQHTGEILVNQQNSNTFPSKDFAQIVAMMPQSKQSLPNLTVRELISYGRAPYHSWLSKTNRKDSEIIDWAMSITNTIQHSDRLFHSLSGGEQQKVRIALALTQQSEILLLDEPTTYLDIAHQLEVMEMLASIHEQHQITIIMVLHELQQAVAYCDYLIAMKGGKIKTTGRSIDLLTRSFLKDVYDIDAKVIYEDGFPLIIPKTSRIAKSS
ncbi:ABC transporter ATP-binding protein [Gracilibacillus suaedae]|uniref:ABC transporter ATP-binding protein n=1 Tax=Gracilibacillus suaedae TaxID=2820273 RepID=UPI001E32B16D|nr:ABC transporter ATP-binding protein [Gracilibacillus suaedae]